MTETNNKYFSNNSITFTKYILNIFEDFSYPPRYSDHVENGILNLWSFEKEMIDLYSLYNSHNFNTFSEHISIKCKIIISIIYPTKMILH